MKIVYQTKYGNEKGNCYQAALASILELELSEVPDFCNLYSNSEWQIEEIKWLNQKGLSCVCLKLDKNFTIEHRIFRDCILIVSGPTQDGVQHSTIYKGNKLIHNPNKNCSGITPEYVDIIFPMEVKL